MNFPEMDLDLKKLLKGRYEAERLPKDFSPERIVPDFAFNVLNPRGLLYRPVVNEDYLQNGGQKPTWPDGKQFAVCLTHDVDAVSSYSLRQSFRAIQNQLLHGGSAFQKVKAFLRAGIDLAWIGRQKDPLHFYERWLGMEKEVGSHSTFFFWPGWSSVTKHHLTDLPYELFDSVVFDNQRCTVAEMIREIYRQGWEIGLHPSWYSFDDADELKRQKESLEQALDNEVISIRQHYLHYDIRSTPRVHADAGFKFDSTLGFNDNIGFRFGTCYPFRLFDLKDEKPLTIFEIPLIIQDVAMLNPNKGMRIDEETAYGYIVHLTEEVKTVGGVLTLLWHPNEIYREKSIRLYSRVLAYLKKQNSWLSSVKEIGNWWLKQRHVANE